MSTKFVSLVYFVAIFGISCSASAEVFFESSYSFQQTGSQDFSGMASEPSNLTATRTTPISSYSFEISAVPDDPFNLKAAVGLEVEANQRDQSETWTDIQITATAKSFIEDLVIVEGVPGATAGKIEFLWAVTGISEISFDDDGAVTVESLKSTGVLTSNVPADVPDIFLHDESGAFGDVESTSPAFSGFESFFVDWSPGSIIPIEFELQVTADLHVENFDAAGFTAEIEADFGNTAVLQQVNIFDGGGNLLDASLVSSNTGFVYKSSSAVPEPSSFSIFATLILLSACQRYASRKNRQSC